MLKITYLVYGTLLAILICRRGGAPNPRVPKRNTHISNVIGSLVDPRAAFAKFRESWEP